MSDTSQPIQRFETLRHQAISALVPFFTENPTIEPKSIRVVAEQMLDGYRAVTPKELQLAAQIVALGWAAMVCLRAAVAVKNLSIDQVLGLQDNAIALDRSSRKVTRALKTRQKERTTNPRALTLENTQWDAAEFQAVIKGAREKMDDANARLAAYMATLIPIKPKVKLPILSAERMTPSVLLSRADLANRAARH